MAQKIENIPEFGTCRENEERRDGGCAVIYDPTTGLFGIGKRELDGLYILFAGGVEADEDMTQGISREVREESGLYDFSHTETIAEALCHYRNKAKNVNRLARATCLLLIARSTEPQPVQLEAHENFTLAWVTAAEIYANWQERNEDIGLSHWMYFLDKATSRLGDLGYEVSSAPTTAA